MDLIARLPGLLTLLGRTVIGAPLRSLARYGRVSAEALERHQAERDPGCYDAAGYADPRTTRRYDPAPLPRPPRRLRLTGCREDLAARRGYGSPRPYTRQTAEAAVLPQLRQHGPE